jgi:hypothetical protein
LADLYERKNNGGAVNPDAFKTMEQLANQNGFAIEKYQVVTSDGYILSLYRIPGTLSETSQQSPLKEGVQNGKPPVFLQHGLESDMM